MKKIFTVWKFVISVGWAKSGLWANTCGKEKRTHIATIRLLQRDGNKAISVILGPASLIVGLVI